MKPNIFYLFQVGFRKDENGEEIVMEQEGKDMLEILSRLKSLGINIEEICFIRSQP